jgi:hypothetical protein
VSDEHPSLQNGRRVASQWVAWVRDATERSALARAARKIELSSHSPLDDQI